MKILLAFIAGMALIYGAMSIPEMLLVSTSPDATVWQQISARLAIGLSLLIFATSAGLAAILGALDQRSQAAAADVGKIVAALRGAPAPVEDPAPAPEVRQPSKAEERRRRLAERMGVTLPTEDEEKATLAQHEEEAGAMALTSGFVVREKSRSKDDLDRAVEQLYGKPQR